ncbi:MAG: (deoxy)nucleoside triphosphate pyrophosphohydrolase [Fuerstiella sp.]
MTSLTKVAVAVVESSGHILVGTRADDAVLAGKSEFPGGKCQPDETPRSCAVRECREETGLMVLPRGHLTTVTHDYDHGRVELHFWRCQLVPDLPCLANATAPFKWVPLDQLQYLDFPEANAEVLQLLTAQTT